MSNLNNTMKIDSWVGRDVLGPFSKGLVHRDRPIPRRTFVSSSLLSQSSFCQSSLQQDSSYHTSLASCIGLLVLELLTLVFYAGDPCNWSSQHHGFVDQALFIGGPFPEIWNRVFHHQSPLREYSFEIENFCVSNLECVQSFFLN